MNNILFLCLFFSNALLAGCVLGSRSGSGNMQSYDGVSAQYVADGQALASQTALELARRYPPARTHLGLVKTDTPFGQSLETHLRSQGFIISTDSQSAPLQASYTLDEVQGESLVTCYLQMRVSDGERFGTVRQLNAVVEAPSNTTPSVLLEAQSSVPSVLEERSLAAQQSGSVPAPLPSDANQHTARAVYTTPPPHAVHTAGTAISIARRNNISVNDFCRWNDTQATTVLRKGHKVYLQEPSTATLNAAPVRPVPTPLPVASETKNITPSTYTAPASATSLLPVAADAPAPLPVVAPPVTPSEASVSPERAKKTDQEALLGSEISTWTITPGNLQAQVSAWSAQANYQLLWKTQNDFEMESHARFQGDFLDAIRQLFTGLQRSGHALRVTLYQGNNVLEVSEE